MIISVTNKHRDKERGTGFGAIASTSWLMFYEIERSCMHQVPTLRPARMPPLYPCSCRDLCKRHMEAYDIVCTETKPHDYVVNLHHFFIDESTTSFVTSQ
jgi:hypothetical protein